MTAASLLEEMYGIAHWRRGVPYAVGARVLDEGTMYVCVRVTNEGTPVWEEV